jgi:hypothetical protein
VGVDPPIPPGLWKLLVGNITDAAWQPESFPNSSTGDFGTQACPKGCLYRLDLDPGMMTWRWNSQTWWWYCGMRWRLRKRQRSPRSAGNNGLHQPRPSSVSLPLVTSPTPGSRSALGYSADATAASWGPEGRQAAAGSSSSQGEGGGGVGRGARGGGGLLLRAVGELVDSG